jgi:hypothetical protein
MSDHIPDVGKMVPDLPTLLAEHVAAGLSERQRAALLAMPAFGSYATDKSPSQRKAFREISVISLGHDVKCRLAQGGRETWSQWTMTSFGARVRAIVEREASNG